MDLLELAIETNASHGWQLSQEDKQPMAGSVYSATADRDRCDKKKRLREIQANPAETAAHPRLAIVEIR